MDKIKVTFLMAFITVTPFWCNAMDKSSEDEFDFANLPLKEQDKDMFLKSQEPPNGKKEYPQNTSPKPSLNEYDFASYLESTLREIKNSVTGLYWKETDSTRLIVWEWKGFFSILDTFPVKPSLVIDLLFSHSNLRKELPHAKIEPMESSY